jgi:hypothetical protein
MNAAWKVVALGAGVILGNVTAAHAGNQYFPRFTHIQDSEDVLNYYDGGYAGDDSTDCPAPPGTSYCYSVANGGPGNEGPGPNWGITFSPGVQVVSNIPTAYDTAHGLPASGTFGNSPITGPAASKALVFVSASNAVMNVLGGFNDGFAFYYVADDGQPVGTLVGSVSVWSEPGGSAGGGTELGSLNLYDTENNFTYTNWVVGSLDFNGNAFSVQVDGAENNVLFQVISIGTTIPNLSITSDTETLPEPAPLGLLGAAMLALGAIRWRRNR